MHCVELGYTPSVRDECNITHILDGLKMPDPEWTWSRMLLLELCGTAVRKAAGRASSMAQSTTESQYRDGASHHKGTA